MDNGVINFDDLYSKDHNCRYYLLKETKVPEGHRSSLTATDGSMQFEYVPASDENGAGGVIINRGGMDADSSVWQSGAFAGSKETITAPSTVYQADDDSMKPGNTVDMKRGTLFAVVFKRDKSKNAWHAVSGDPTKGYTLAGAQGMAGAIEAAKKDLYAFTLNTSGQYQVEIPYLPGDISKYYYLLSGDARKNAEYAVAIYYTTASSIADANTDNTVHVFSDDLPGDQVNFKRQFATSLLVTNIQNRLFVQKTDTEGNPVDGAKFGLYTDGQVTTDANGKVVLNGDQIPYDTLTTGQVSNPIQLEGAGIFPCTSDGNKPLVKGAYFLKEVSAPKGFLLNDTLTKVIVDDYGVHADAGTADDGVSTFVGPGTLMKSLGQFGAESDIDNTLTWIKGMRQTSDGVTDGGNLSWSDVDSAGAGDTVHLKYGANGRIYQYGPTKAGEPYRLETETGWIRMGITQDEPGVTNAKGARADLGDMNLNALFTGATCVRVANEREASLEVTKKVDVPDGLTGNKDAGFTFNFTVPAGKTYKAAVFEKAGTAGERRVGNVFNLTNGYSQTIKADETIRVYGLSEGDEYTVQELTGADQMPAGYKLTGRKQGATDLKDAGDRVTGKIAKQNTDGTLAEANKLVFTNSYSVKSSVTLTGIKAKKKFTGREWTSADSFELCLRAADGTPMPDGATAAPVAGMKQVEKTVTSAEEFSFGEIKYEKPGEYTYYIAETTPAKSDPSWLGGVSYSSAEYKVTVTVKDDGKGNLTEPVVKMEQIYKDDGTATSQVIDDQIAVITNTYRPKETSVTLAAKKAYVKSDSTPAALKGGEFAFDLYEGDLTAEQLKGKQPIRSAKNGEDGTVTFPAINYTKAGEYKYTIVEKKGDLSHVTFDDAVHHAAVKVMDKAGKLDAAVAYDGDKADAPTFTNTYTAKGSVELTATKVVAVAPGFTHDTKLKGGEYTFELKDADGKVLDTAKNEADGTVKFTRDFELADLGGAASKDFAYTIVEQPGAEPGMVYDSHPLTYTVTVTDGGNGALNAKAIVTSASGSDTFTNTYQPAATGLALGAQKSYVKKDDNTPIVPKCGEFTFDVYEGNLTAEQLAGAKPVRTATNGADGSVNFDAFSYAKPGTHEYTIVERKGDLAYVTYDAAVHHAVVTVADNAGTLQASVAYDGTNVTKPSFTNTYEAQATDSGAIALTKSVDVHDGSYQLKAGDFAFELVGSDGTVIQTQKNDAHGKVAFDKLTFDHAGTFTYTVREVQPTGDAPGVPGVTYTGKTYTLTYVVKDNNDGKLVVENSTVKPSEGTENGVTPNTMTFANSYQPGATSYQISGTKVLENTDSATMRTPADGEFTFALIDVATGQEIDRTTNVGNAFTFKAISYTATGSHAYQVKEVAGQDGTITYSDAVLDVTVSATDDGSGQLTATANKTAADLTFTNTYTPTATTATITGTKALTGRDLAEGEFSFDLKDADGNVVQTVQNGADGTFGFAPLQLDKVGTYVYTVSERAGATANGVTYDTTVFTATVTVTENAETHALETQVAYSKGGKAADAVAFSNSYAPAATEVKLGASKVLSGKDLKEGQFSFQLKDADGKVLQTAKNAADGTVGFEAISYDKPGTYAYSISEVDDGQKNVTYDAAEHRVTVTVTDDGAGHLVATVTYDGDVAPVFKNTYTPPTTPPVNPPTNPPSKPPVPKEEKPGLPNMGDTSLSPMALGGIAGGAVVLIAAGVILRRRNR